MRVAEGTRDAAGVWHPNDPGQYKPMDVHGALPWSVLRQDSREWQERKKWWYERGVDDIAPRSAAKSMISTGRHGAISAGVSRFDPHLAEMLYTWFCPPGGFVIDPLAGGPVRGIVAGSLGLRYVGIDLLSGQISANRRKAEQWNHELIETPRWDHGDARDVLTGVEDESFDYGLSCPPYWNRERYSDDPRDLSAMSWPRFLDAHALIILNTVRVLKADSFVTWVVSDVRDSRGHLRSLPARTVDAFEAAGASLTNEQILVGPAGTLAKTMRPAWEACRTTTRRHQIVLTFVKGDRRKATRRLRADR